MYVPGLRRWVGDEPAGRPGSDAPTRLDRPWARAAATFPASGGPAPHDVPPAAPAGAPAGRGLPSGGDTFLDRVAEIARLRSEQSDLDAVDGRAKIVLSSRRQHFWSDGQVLTKLGERVETLAASRVASLEGFSEAQAADYLTRLYGDAGLAKARLRLIHEIEDLSGLAQNPRMLSFIAELDEARLRAVQARTGTISSAELYAELVDAWLDLEEKRADQRGAAPLFAKAELRDAATRLALACWGAAERTVGLEELTATAAEVLATMADARGLDEAQAAQILGSGTLLARDAGGRFSFIHSSVMEYLVADEAARRLAGGCDDPAGDLLGTHEVSDLTADFYAAITGRERAAGWAQAVLDDAGASRFARVNAFKVARMIGLRLRTGANLAGADLAGQDLSDRNLADADLTGANLTDASLVSVNLDGARLSRAVLAGAVIRDSTMIAADLADAVFDGAQIHNGRLDRATLRGARLDRVRIVGGRFRGADLAGARMREVQASGADFGDVDLHGADLTAVRLTDVDLGGVRVATSRWLRAAVLGGRIDEAVLGSVELADAATPRRDPAGTRHPPTRSPVYAVGFSPDGTLLASGAADGAIRLWSAATGEPAATLVWLDGGGWAALLPGGAYKLVGDPGERFWWGLGTVRFAPGELDPYVPSIRRLADGERILLPAGGGPAADNPRRLPPDGAGPSGEG
jgi:uncharacterized protein YjbI with pentapeptide repeats